MGIIGHWAQFVWWEKLETNLTVRLEAFHLIPKWGHLYLMLSARAAAPPLITFAPNVTLSCVFPPEPRASARRHWHFANQYFEVAPALVVGKELKSSFCLLLCARAATQYRVRIKSRTATSFSLLVAQLETFLLLSSMQPSIAGRKHVGLLKSSTPSCLLSTLLSRGHHLACIQLMVFLYPQRRDQPNQHVELIFPSDYM